MLTANDLPPLPEKMSALHFGSFSLAVEPCGAAYEDFARREKGERVISLDINVRSTLIRDRVDYLARIERMAAMSDIIKMSEEDLAWLAPPDGVDALAKRWLDAGAALVVLTRGAEGATAIIKAGRVDAPAVLVEVADTIGAGDSFTAALLARLRKRDSLTKAALAELPERLTADALGFAVKAAAITVSRAGADPPWLRELP
jgi:fructokinase